MARNMKGILLMIREKDKVNLLGKTEEYMMANGKMENNMAVENSFLKMVSKELANGKTEEKLNG